MELPAISIPEGVLKSIPMEQIPSLVHPPLVHFAIVLPIMIVLLELVNIIVKRGATPEESKGRGVSTLSFLLIIAMVVIFALVYLSGSVDGKAAWDGLSETGQAGLKEHKLMGIYLLYGSVVLLAFKFLSLIGPKSRILFLLLAIAFAAATLNQGKKGGELVYVHGANVEAVKELDSKIFDLNDEIDTLKSENEKLKNTTVAPAPEATPEVKEEASAPVIEQPVVAAPTPEVQEEVKAEVVATETNDEKQADTHTETTPEVAAQ